MISLKTFIMKCKQHCNQILSVLDDSHNYETAVEAFIKESEGKQTIEIQEKDENLYEKDCLYSEPTNEYFQDNSNENTSPNEYKELLNNESIRANEVDQILELCNNVPSEINVLPFDTNKIDTQVNDEEINKKHIDIENIQYIEKDPSNNIILALKEIIEELDSIYKQTNDSNVLTTIEFCQSRIIEALINNGCSIMKDFALFNSTHHVTRPFSIIKNGTKIQSYIRNGVIHKGKVLLKAIVKIEE